MPDFPRVVFAEPLSAEDLALCRKFGVEPSLDASAADWVLFRDALHRLRLRACERLGGIEVGVDLSGGDLARRLRTARKDQPLARAASLHRRPSPPTVLDATAGLGRDAFLLAQLGCEVTAIERVPALALLLAEAASRAAPAHPVVIHCAEAERWLRERDEGSFDVVVLDPMFPTQGRAQVKKEMQACRLLAGPPGDCSLLVHEALRAARERVIVKRHPHELPLHGAPSFAIDGERVRFDVYLKPAAGPQAP